MEEPNKTEERPIRDAKGLFLPGNPGSPGRPKGTSLKEYWKKRLADMTPEEKELWIEGIGKDLIWRMAEGNPHNTEDIDVGFKPIPLDDVHKDERVQEDKEIDKEG